MNWYRKMSQRSNQIGEYEDYHLDPRDYSDIGHEGTPSKEITLWMMGHNFNMYYKTSKFGEKSHTDLFPPRLVDNALAYGRIDENLGMASIMYQDRAIARQFPDVTEDRAKRNIKRMVIDDIQNKTDVNIRFKEFSYDDYLKKMLGE